MALSYPGLNPSNVSEDAKYKVRTGPSGSMVVKLVYRLTAREKQLLTTERHDQLVSMVNDVKVEITGQPGGAFYINEYFDVLVPTTQSKDGCKYAGTYERLLEFEWERGTISPQPPGGLQIGDPWPGPHVGIKYILAAGGNDIYYERRTSPGRTEKHLLSDYHDDRHTAEFANRLARIKGSAGGPIYINEIGEFFAPTPVDGGLTYVYLGPLEDAPWFPPPDVPRT